MLKWVTWGGSGVWPRCQCSLGWVFTLLTGYFSWHLVHVVPIIQLTLCLLKSEWPASRWCFRTTGLFLSFRAKYWSKSPCVWTALVLEQYRMICRECEERGVSRVLQLIFPLRAPSGLIHNREENIKCPFFSFFLLCTFIVSIKSTSEDKLYFSKVKQYLATLEERIHAGRPAALPNNELPLHLHDSVLCFIYFAPFTIFWLLNPPLSFHSPLSFQTERARLDKTTYMARSNECN